MFNIRFSPLNLLFNGLNQQHQHRHQAHPRPAPQSPDGLAPGMMQRMAASQQQYMMGAMMGMLSMMLQSQNPAGQGYAPEGAGGTVGVAKAQAYSAALEGSHDFPRDDVGGPPGLPFNSCSMG